MEEYKRAQREKWEKEQANGNIELPDISITKVERDEKKKKDEDDHNLLDVNKNEGTSSALSSPRKSDIIEQTDNTFSSDLIEILKGCGLTFGGVCGVLLVILLALCCFAGIITLIAIVIDSVNFVDYDEIGIAYNRYTTTVGDKVYTPGAYFLGPGGIFIKYKRFAQTIDMSLEDGRNPLKARTKEGLAITLDVSFQYKLNPDKMITMFLAFGERRFEDFIFAESRNVIRDVTSRYLSLQFFTDRDQIRSDMIAGLTSRFDRLGGGLKFLHFQFRRVYIAPSIDNAIVLAQSSQEAIIQNDLNRTLTSRKESIRIDVEQRRAKIIGINAEAEKTAINIIEQAQKRAIEIVYNAQREADERIMNTMHLNSTELYMYKYIQYLKHIQIGDIFINMKSPYIVTVEQQQNLASLVQKFESDVVARVLTPPSRQGIENSTINNNTGMNDTSTPQSNTKDHK